jgi:alanyl-tRNA synthetase
MQSNREKDRSLTPLKAKNVDTGMGFERVVAVLQGVDSNYHTDLFLPIIKELESICGRRYLPGPEGTPFRVAADHIRALVFAITDGALPSNDGRGYVLRRLLRRAARFGRELGCREPFMFRLVPSVISVMGSAFPEITVRSSHVQEVIKAEEERFGATLEQGINKFDVMVDLCLKNKSTTLPGSDVFALYDTYGFPMDLTRLMAGEKGLSVDEKEFDLRMNEQKERGRDSRKGDDTGLTPDGWTELKPCNGTTFVGYEKETATVSICRYKAIEKPEGGFVYLLILDTSPFYAESGGQAGDTGALVTASNKKLTVETTVKWNDLVIHKAFSPVPVSKDDLIKPMTASIEKGVRAATRRNHSATHLLQAALRAVLGDHVHQSGSRVDAGGLRFDFNHFKALSGEEIKKIGRMVNEWVLADLPVETIVKDTETAKKEGAMALFGEKYGDTVRVVTMGARADTLAISKELCGGTHVSRTGQIGLFHITEESSIASGVRRIEAITGLESCDFLDRSGQILEELSLLLKAGKNALVERTGALLDKVKELETALATASAEQAAGLVSALVETALAKQGDVKWHVQTLGNIDKKKFTESVNAVSDTIKTKNLDTTVIVLAGIAEGAVMLAACAGNKAAKTFGIHCGEIVKAAASIAGGSGGGSPTRAQAGGKDPSKLEEALLAATAIITSKTKAS